MKETEMPTRLQVKTALVTGALADLGGVVEKSLSPTMWSSRQTIGTPTPLSNFMAVTNR